MTMRRGREHAVTIGLEFRCRLATRTGLFSACPSAMGAPGSQADAYTLALPGTLPTLNRQAVDRALRLALALGAAIEPLSRWVRKHHFDPTLPKGYQLTQLESPLARGGTITIAGRSLTLTSIRLAEEPGALRSGRVDLDHAGAPLLEIVAASMRMHAAPEEAPAYLRALRAIVRASRVADADMPGHLRCDAHVSIWPKGQGGAGAPCTIRDLRSGAVLARAIAAEIRRQTVIVERGEPVASMFFTYDAIDDRSRVLREQSAKADPLYLPEPDLPPLRVDAAWVERLRGVVAGPGTCPVLSAAAQASRSRCSQRRLGSMSGRARRARHRHGVR